MPRPKIGKRVCVNLPPELFEFVEEYRKKNNFSELSEAIRQILYKARQIISNGQEIVNAVPAA